MCTLFSKDCRIYSKDVCGFCVLLISVNMAFAACPACLPRSDWCYLVFNNILLIVSSVLFF